MSDILVASNTHTTIPSVVLAMKFGLIRSRGAAGQLSYMCQIAVRNFVLTRWEQHYLHQTGRAMRRWAAEATSAPPVQDS